MKRSILFHVATYTGIMLAGGLVSVNSALAEKFPATGQTTAYQAVTNDGDAIPDDVPDDGTLQRGKGLRYNVKDGIIEDKNTGLIWEMKIASSDPLCTDGTQATRDFHCVNNIYVWSGNGFQETIWDWLEDINAEGGTGYAGHNDWRIPNLRELQSIVDYEEFKPAIDPIFGPAVVSKYWSSTTVTHAPGAWFVDFGPGNVVSLGKSFTLFVRAVRGGPK